MVDQATKYSDGTVFNVEVGVLHTVEEHEQVLVARDKRVELRIEVLQHGHTNTVIVVGRRSHEELVQQFVHDSYHYCTQALERLPTVGLGEAQRAAGLHGVFPHGRVLVVEVVEH